MIYHICPHFDTFVKIAFERFERIKPGNNRCIELYEKTPTLTNMRIKDDKGIIFLSTSIEETRWVEILLSDCTGIMVHHLQDYMLDPLLSLPSEIPIHFRSYGGDIFDILYEPDQNFLLWGTKRVLVKNDPMQYLVNPAINRLYCKIFPHQRTWDRTREKKISFLSGLFAISTSCPYEYEMILEKLPGLKLDYLPFFYYPPEGLDAFNCEFDKENILVGHSNSPGQNHIDTFKLLGNYRITGKIIATLSYGTGYYTNAVIAAGNKTFGDRFYPLTQFLPKQDYYGIISSCYAFIEQSYYQQGLANIVFMLSQGSSVYLPEENPIYIFFKRAGLAIFSIEHDLNEDHLCHYRLNEVDIQKNQTMLHLLFSLEMDENTANKIVHSFV